MTPEKHRRSQPCIHSAGKHLHITAACTYQLHVSWQSLPVAAFAAPTHCDQPTPPSARNLNIKGVVCTQVVLGQVLAREPLISESKAAALRQLLQRLVAKLGEEQIEQLDLFKVSRGSGWGSASVCAAQTSSKVNPASKALVLTSNAQPSLLLRQVLTSLVHARSSRESRLHSAAASFL